MNIAELLREIELAAQYNRRRAAFGSIIRRHYGEISAMTPDEKKQFINTLGFTPAYYTELQKELSVVEYDVCREHLNIEELLQEIELATQHNCRRAAFGSIIRGHYDEISAMTPDEKQQFINTLGFTPAYYTELRKELSVVEYDVWRVHQ